MRKVVVLVVPLLLLVMSGCSSSVTLVDHPTGSNTALAHVGDTLDLYTLSGKHFNVQLTKVIDPATAKKANAGSGRRFVAVVFHITNTSNKQLQANLGADTVVLSASGTQYNHDRVALKDCAGSENEQFTLDSGKSATLCAAFRLHTSVTVAQVQFLPTVGAANDYGQWLVP
jgi:hypothetical protein